MDNGKPFPTRQLLILGLCRLAEPVAFISIVSYNFAMVTDLRGPENASFYAGLLVSAFAIAEASTAMLWGSLSDRIGRKPVILIGLVGTTISSLILGLAPNYWIALLARLAGGLLNGNVAVMQTMVAEIVKNPVHEPRAYSIQPFAWSLGSIAGSALGGYAAQPARFYPDYFPPGSVFARFPYLLPNLIAATCVVLAIVQALLFLEETNPRVAKISTPEVTEVTSNEHTPLLVGTKESKRRHSYIAVNNPTPTDPSFDVRRSSVVSISSFVPGKDMAAVESAIEEVEEDRGSSIFTEDKTISTRPIMWIVAIALMCYHQMAFVSAFPTYLLDAPQLTGKLDLMGGLGLNVHDVGRYMSVNSFWSILIQIFVLPVFMRKVGLRASICSLTIILPIVDILIPFVTILDRPRLAIYFAFATQAFCTIIIHPSLLIMLKNETPSAILGKVNGVAVSASSAARTIAPPLVGIIYSRLGSAWAWWSCALFGSFAIVELFFLPHQKVADDDHDNDSSC